MTATTASASPGAARRSRADPAVTSGLAAGITGSGGAGSRRDRAGITAVSRTPASSQPSDRYSGIVAGYSADNG